MSKSNKKHRKNRKDLISNLEKLESRQMFSVVTVTPQNFQGVINSSSQGDTVEFTPGNYILSPASNGGSATFLAGRKYVGNGATFGLNSGVDSSNSHFLVSVEGGSASQSTEVTGFTFTDAQILSDGGSVNIHGDTFTNGSRGIFVNDSSNSEYENNTFTNLSSEGIASWNVGSNDKFDNNNFTHVWEPIHLVGEGNGNDVSNNVISEATRIGIELQNGMTNLTVDNNWMGNWLSNVSNGVDSHMGISAALGYADNVTIEGNTLLMTGDKSTWAMSGIEIMGSNVKIENNVLYNWANGILNGLQGGTNIVSGNQVYGGVLVSNDGVTWPIAGINTGDHVQSLSAYSPASSPSGTSSGSGTATSSSAPVTASAPVTQPTIPSGITAVANRKPGEITVTAPAGSKLTVYASSMDPSSATNLGKITGTTAIIGGIPATWNVTVTVTTAGKTYTLPSVQVNNSSIAANGTFSPAFVTATTTTGTTSTGTVSSTAPVTSSTSIPSGIVAVANGRNGQLTVDAPAGSKLAIYASTMDPSSAISLGKINGTSATINGIPLDWFVTVTVTTGGVTYTLPEVQVLVSTISSSGSFNPALGGSKTVSPTPAPVVSTPAPVVSSATAAPGNFAASSPSSTEVDLKWTGTSHSAVYILERRATNGSSGFQEIARLAAGTTSYKDTNVASNWEYDYELTAVANGVSSKATLAHTQVQAGTTTTATTTTTTTAPTASATGVSAPSNFAAAWAGSTKVNLSWTDNTGGAANFILQRRATNGSSAFTTIATIAAGVDSYQDTHVAANRHYDYRIVAVEGGVSSATVATSVAVQGKASSSAPVVSSTAPVSVPSSVSTSRPAAPTVLLAASPNSSEVDLSWVDNSGGTATYVVGRRATNGNGGFQPIAALPAGASSYQDSKVKAGKQYDYYIVAVQNGSNSWPITVHTEVQPMLSISWAKAA